MTDSMISRDALNALPTNVHEKLNETGLLSHLESLSLSESHHASMRPRCGRAADRSNQPSDLDKRREVVTQLQ